MLIIDDLLLSPVKGVLWVFRKIQQTAEEELQSRQARTRSELSDLYMQLETGRITEDEFNAREKQLLDRLDEIKAIQQRQAGKQA
jgi:flagellar motility protein MotE (MotC chaperone)